MLGADGAGAEHIRVGREDGVIRMRGHETFREAVARLTLATLQAVRAAGSGWRTSTCSSTTRPTAASCPPSASGSGCAPDRVVDCIAEHGNTSAATLPLALAFSEREGLLTPGAACCSAPSAPASPGGRP